MPSIESLKRELDRLSRSVPAGDTSKWPPKEGDGDGLLVALAAGAGSDPLPTERPDEPLLYLLHRVAGVVWGDFDEAVEIRRGRGGVGTS